MVFIDGGHTMEAALEDLRGWSGKPTHPPLTDIPVAAYVLGATFDTVSVLFATVGRFQMPSSTERGGFVRGWPRTPITCIDSW